MTQNHWRYPELRPESKLRFLVLPSVVGVSAVLSLLNLLLPAVAGLYHEEMSSEGNAHEL